MATTKTAIEKETILSHKEDQQEQLSMKKFRDKPSLSPVAVKEAILIKEWLRFHRVFPAELSYKQQIEKIKSAIQKVIDRYFCPWLDDR